ncbi:MAG TPA: hypothetical protein H9694_04065 [Firmicutes bacterium]|nr:hypothetical protein [Bacillota bacterium]
MKTTLAIYILLGILFIVPLILFNIRKIWVKKPPDPVKFKPVRFTVIALLCVFIAVFLTTAYRLTLQNRYEIATERLAEQHAQAIVGSQTIDDFRDFLLENGTENLEASLAEMEFPDYGDVSEARFQLSDWCIPRYWEGNEAFEQVEVLDSNNPVYILYRMVAGGRNDLILVRMRNTDDGWKYDAISMATEEQVSVVKAPLEKTGKWYTVKAD